ncbi:hypothetical protein KAV79_08615 [Candidatus Aerophobetes bacterium]|nr:hypothetical protein [Candidatus Aerophobetes bacterium]
MPDPLLFDWFGEEIDWEERKAQLKQAKKGGNLARGLLVHGFTYMWLYYLRGFTKVVFIIDITLIFGFQTLYFFHSSSQAESPSTQHIRDSPFGQGLVSVYIVR